MIGTSNCNKRTGLRPADRSDKGTNMLEVGHGRELKMMRGERNTLEEKKKEKINSSKWEPGRTATQAKWRMGWGSDRGGEGRGTRGRELPAGEKETSSNFRLAGRGRIKIKQTNLGVRVQKNSMNQEK